MCLGQRACRSDCFACNLDKVDLGKVEREGAGIDAAQEEQIVHHLVEPTGVAPGDLSEVGVVLSQRSVPGAEQFQVADDGRQRGA